MNNMPLTASYARTSGNSQSEEMQIAAAHAYFRRNGITEYLELIDHGITATKNSISQRPELSKLLDLIKSGKIKQLVVYSRDRLARNSYEYVQLIDIFYEYKVDVVFTATNSFPFSFDRVIEMLLAVFSTYEGSMIKTRISDLYKQTPPQIFGYVKEKDGKQINYFINLETKDNILELFRDCAEVKDSSRFIEMIHKQEKRLKRDTNAILSILKNPFYAAFYEKEETGFYPLPHVEPLISLELSQVVRDKVKQFRNEVLKKLAPTHLIFPICQYCKTPMKLIGKSLVNNGRFHCSNGHPRLTISVDQLNQLTQQAISSFIQEINFEKIRTITVPYLRKMISLNEKEESLINKNRNKLSQITSLQFDPSKPIPLLTRRFEELARLREATDDLIEKRLQYKRVLQESKGLHSLISESLQNKLSSCQFSLLASYLIKYAQVNSNDTVSYELYFGDFTKVGIQ